VLISGIYLTSTGVLDAATYGDTTAAGCSFQVVPILWRSTWEISLRPLKEQRGPISNTAQFTHIRRIV